jgi:H+-transporting ATPase
MGTQAVATLIAVYGLFMTPLGWGWALFVWGWAVAWALLNDGLKLITYWVLDSTASRSPQKAKSDPAPDAKAAPKPEAEPQVSAPVPVASKPEAKADDAKPDATKAATAKPGVESAPQSGAQADGAKAESANPSGAAPAEAAKPVQAKPDAAPGPQTNLKADNAAPAVPKAGADKPDAAKAAELKPDVNAQPEAESNAGLTKLMHTALGDVLLAGLAKDPRSVERIVAEAITKAEAAPPPRAHKRAKPTPSPRHSRNLRLGRKLKPAPSRHPKPSPKSKSAPTRRPK